MCSVWLSISCFKGQIMSLSIKLKAILIAAALTATSGAVFAEVVVVVSTKNAVGSLTADQVGDVFLGKITSLPGGASATPVDQAEGSALRDDFYNKVTGKSAAQMKAYWSKIIFTGKGQPPKEVADNAAVKKLVADSPSAIGYIDKSALDSSVKAVFSR